MKRLLAAMALVAGCASAAGPQPDGLLDATYGVEATGCSLVSRFGSGVAVDTDLIVTAAHTVAGAQAIEVHANDGSSHRAELVAIDKDLDLAALRIDQTLRSLDVAPVAKDTEGWLLVWSSTGGTEARPTRVTRTLRITIEDIYVDGEVERLGFEFEGDVATGDSGGAVVDADGSILGIVYAASRDRKVGFATRKDEIDNVLATVGDPLPDLTCVP